MKIALVVFAGRKENLELQRPYVDRILEDYPNAEYHLWNLTRNPEDDAYVRSLEGGRVKVFNQLHTGFPIRCNRTDPNSRRRCECIVHKPPYERPYDFYADSPAYKDTVFVKLDDDVVFFEADRFEYLLTALAARPNAVISANVVNNVVCTKHDTPLRQLAAKEFSPEDDREWWWLHTEPQFARLSHEWFLDNWRPLTKPDRQVPLDRARPGELVSINMIAFTHPTMKRISDMIGREGRLGDEGAVDRLLPRIATGFRAAHLTFGPQDKGMSLKELADLRSRYAAVAKEYLGD